MPLASFHLFAAVVATLSAQLRRLDALAIEAAGRGVLVAAHPLANLRAQGVVEALPVPAGTPWAEIPIDTGPLGILMGEHAPFDAPVDDIKNRIDHRPHIERAVASTRFVGDGIKSVISSHSASERSVGYGLGFIPRVY